VGTRPVSRFGGIGIGGSCGRRYSGVSGGRPAVTNTASGSALSRARGGRRSGSTGGPVDEPGIAELPALNCMPRWVAFEERFTAAEKNGEIPGTLRYRAKSNRPTVGLLVVDPWANEARMARALYGGARDLAREMGVREIAALAPHADYPGETGYRGGAGASVWRLGSFFEISETLPASGWRRVFTLCGCPRRPVPTSVLRSPVGPRMACARKGRNPTIVSKDSEEGGLPTPDTDPMPVANQRDGRSGWVARTVAGGTVRG
jgi:hypothetical protein